MTITIADVEWQMHLSGLGRRASVVFDNGYTASIITGPAFCSTPDCPYEIAIINTDTGSISYDTPLTYDVLGYLTEEEANDALAAIAALPPTMQEALRLAGLAAENQQEDK